MLRGILLTIALCAALAFAGCGGSGEETTSAGDTTAAEAPAPEAGAAGEKPTVKVPDGEPPKQLKTVDLKQGSGPAAKAGDAVTVQYVGVNFKSGEQFDASWDRGEPFTFTLGGGEVIRGWDIGVEGMKPGGRRQLIIPAGLGYGPSGYPPAIPPNETLVFVVDLVEVN